MTQIPFLSQISYAVILLAGITKTGIFDKIFHCLRLNGSTIFVVNLELMHKNVQFRVQTSENFA
ncbi:MAG: hypothetical protein ACFFFT_11250 [Candidatus Thorarchaeota archaeon]